MVNILIYIPSHTDYLLARENINRILANSKEAYVKNRCRVILSLSVNGVNLTDQEIKDFKSSVDEFHYYPFNIGGDANICQGYLRALEIQPDYFWIVSANEFIQERALEYLCDLIESNPYADFFIANAANRIKKISPKFIFTDIEEKSSIGLITSTIYKFKTTHKYYFMANQWLWTGWGQLAVIQTVILSKKSSVIIEYPDHNIYSQPYSYKRDLDLHLEEHIRNLYHKSFFSQPIIAAYFMGKDKFFLRKYLIRFLKENWYKINYFRDRKQHFDNSEEKLDPLWLESLFFTAIKNISFILLIVVKILYHLPIYKFRKNWLLIYIYGKYKKCYFLKSTSLKKE